MTKGDLEKRLDFLREASRLKDILRRTYTHGGQTESTAEHTWALCLLVMTFADQLEGIDLLKLLKICILHDLGKPFTVMCPRSRCTPRPTNPRRSARIC